MDLSNTIQPKSDQLDAIDLLTGDRTFTIERVSRNNDEQPINIYLAEFPRPWRPGLSMRRVLVSCWGADASAYVGRRVTLYCDPDVQFGGAAVGGTRIRALSHIDKPKQVPLLIKRGKSAMFIVKPLADEPVKAPAKRADEITSGQLQAVSAGLIGLGITERDAMLATVAQVIDREISSAMDLTPAEAATVLDWIKHEETADAEPTLPRADQ